MSERRGERRGTRWSRRLVAAAVAAGLIVTAGTACGRSTDDVLDARADVPYPVSTDTAVSTGADPAPVPPPTSTMAPVAAIVPTTAPGAPTGDTGTDDPVPADVPTDQVYVGPTYDLPPIEEIWDEAIAPATGVTLTERNAVIALLGDGMEHPFPPGISNVLLHDKGTTLYGLPEVMERYRVPLEQIGMPLYETHPTDGKPITLIPT